MAFHRHRAATIARSRTNTPALPLLFCLWREQVDGTPATFAHGERHELRPKPKHTNPRSAETRANQRRQSVEVEPANTPPANHPDNLRVPTLSEAEVIRGLMRCLHDRKIPLRHVARAAEISHMAIYRALRSGTASEPIRAALTPVLQAIAAGTLTYQRIGQVWQAVEHEPPPHDPLAWQDKAVRAEDFNYGRCRSCGGRNYTRVTLHGTDAEWFLCDGCLWWKTAGMGAQPVEVRQR
jgi:hypothetical protein